MSTDSIHIRLSSGLYERVCEYASNNTDGVINRAVNELLGRALDSSKEDALAAMVDAAVERGFDHLAKASSRGTKASLANLILLSQMLPGIADTQHVQFQMLGDLQNNRDAYEETIEDAEYELSSFQSRGAGYVFDWAWRCAGNIQKAGSRPTLKSAKCGADLFGGM